MMEISDPEGDPPDDGDQFHAKQAQEKPRKYVISLDHDRLVCVMIWINHSSSSKITCKR